MGNFIDSSPDIMDHLPIHVNHAAPVQKSPFENPKPIGVSVAGPILKSALTKLSLTHNELNYSLQNIESAVREYKDFYVIQANLVKHENGSLEQCKASILHRPFDVNDCITEATFEIKGKDKYVKVKI